MCEFKIVKQKDGSQICEEIVVITHGNDNELIFKDILGSGEVLESALIMEVNTLNQTTVVLEHPLIKDFIGLMKKITESKANKEDISSFKNKLDSLNL